MAKLNQQMARARQLQHDLLPRSLPESDSVRFSTLYVPAGELSGDIYDVVRLGDRQLSINISAATGHDMAAAMLSIFMKQSLRAREAVVHQTRRAGIEHPHELLSKLNDELVAADLSECHFLTSIHAVFDEVDRNLLWARGGMPYPILLHRGASPQAWRDASASSSSSASSSHHVKRPRRHGRDVEGRQEYKGAERAGVHHEPADVKGG